MTSRALAVCAVLTCLGFSCATTTKLAPLAPRSVEVPVPLQQEQLAAAARQAVAETVGKLEYPELAGKVARVQVAAVYPPSQEDLLGFVAAAAEGELAERGVRLEPKAVPQATILQTSAPPPQPDFVASLTLDASGVDVTAEPQLTGPFALMGVGGGLMGLGLIGAVIGALSYTTALLAVGGGAGALGLPLLLFGAVWAANPPAHYIADARVKMAVSVQPSVPGIRGQRRAGEGHKAARYEPEKQGGLRRTMFLPY